MENMSLLDLKKDILNIIGDYVKADNNIIEFNELKKKCLLKLINYLKD